MIVWKREVDPWWITGSRNQFNFVFYGITFGQWFLGFWYRKVRS